MLYCNGKQLRDGSHLTTLFPGKPPRDTFPVLSARSFTSNQQLALLESAEEGNYFSTKECAGREDRCYEVDMLQTELPRSVSTFHETTQSLASSLVPYFYLQIQLTTSELH